MKFLRQQLVGSWYRSDVDQQGCVHTEYAQVLDDGSYEFSFSVHDQQGEIVQQSLELGDWGLVGDIHFTIAKAEYIDNEMYASDLADPDNYHAYKVLELNEQIFKYQHIVSEEVFILRRVIDKIAHC
ncbi:hypothetical protein tinsulaeT_03940 [Thalassotalea insulae]|uniref:Uncharacterized protein n=1 Tax=Thalassotalea insulae TaxID=2056778 RepID=A0ABQ6GNC1_9GAMM|nr:hypothetical protein [Thalassotalea insulae]GLX77054.1 hypothetical protein tinsulaeT_03940 [Thalassotalea insulae]